MQYTLRGKIANITPLTLDKTLSLEGASADAKAVGDGINEAKTLANNAQTSADNAQTTADGAKTAADNAKTSADNAQTTADDALSKANTNAETLATKAETETYSGVFLASGWGESAPYMQGITVEGILNDDEPIVDIDLSNVEDVLSVIEAWGLVHRCIVSEDNTIVAYCYQDAPAVDISVVFKVVR